MKKISLLIILAISGVVAFAQDSSRHNSRKDLRRQRINELIKQEEEGVITYKKHTAVGLKMTTDGYGGFLEIGRAQSVKKALLFQLDISERKHQKEEKVQFNNYNTAPIIYKKLNYFYPVKIGIAQQFLLGNKSNKNGVSVTANFGGGLIAGLLRPYMVEVIGNNGREFVKYDPSDTSSLFLQPSTYLGGPGLGQGWKYLKVTPGAYLKPAVRFDYGKYNELVSAIEVGVYGEYYTKGIPMMLGLKENKLFVTGYVSIMFGKRK